MDTFYFKSAVGVNLLQNYNLLLLKSDVFLIKTDLDFNFNFWLFSRSMSYYVSYKLFKKCSDLNLKWPLFLLKFMLHLGQDFTCTKLNEFLSTSRTFSIKF